MNFSPLLRFPLNRKLAVVAGLSFLLALAAPAALAADLGAIEGSVEVGIGEPPSWEPARAGQSLEAGQRVRTGRGAHAEVNLDGATVRLYGNSVLRLPERASGEEGSSGVQLEKGSSLFDVIKRHLGAPFEVETPMVVVSVKGTRFSVDLAEHDARVSVFRGTVGVRPPDATEAVETLVREGFAARGGLDRAFDLEVSMMPDPWDRWLDGAPADLREGAALERPAARDRMLAAARASAHRRNDERVMKHATARSPELTRRLEEAADERKRERNKRGRMPAGMGMPGVVAPPAKPAPGGPVMEMKMSEAAVRKMTQMGIDPEDAMQYVEERMEELDDMNQGCMLDCEDPVDPGEAFYIVSQLGQQGMSVDDAENAVVMAIQTIGLNQLQTMISTGASASEIEAQFQSTFTGSMGLADDTSDLLIQLMYLQFESYFNSAGGTP